MAGDRRPRRDEGRDYSGGYRGRHDKDARRDRRDRSDDYRRRDDDRDNRSRRYRSRSRSAERGGNHRDRRRDDRDRSRDRENRDWARRPQGDRDDRRRGDERDRGFKRDQPRDRDGRRSASPRRRSASPGQDGRDDWESHLPTRSKFGSERSGAPPSGRAGRGRHERDGPPPHGEDNDANDNQPRDASMGAEDQDDDLEVEQDDEIGAMQAMMGFGGFGTTKNKKIVGNNVGAVRKEKKTEYRQYMNRVGGFNRPLSPTR